MAIENLLIDPDLFALLVLVLVMWSLVWKGIALWKAARNSHRTWFIILLVVNTLAILELVYIFGFSRRKNTPPVVTSSADAPADSLQRS